MVAQRWRWLVAVLLAAVHPPASALAHHTPGHGIAWIGPSTVVEMEAGAASFDLGDRSGSWFATATALEYAPDPRVSFLARIPVAWIDYDSGETASGLADIELGGKTKLLAARENRLLLWGGASLELPTGDEEAGLGGGHVELSPHVMASAEPLPGLHLHSVASDHISLSGGDEPEAGALRGPLAGPDTARRALEARGIEVEPIHEPGPGLRVAEFRDPDGRRIAIEERRTS